MLVIDREGVTYFNTNNNNNAIYLKLTCRIAKANKRQLYTTYNDN